MPAASVADASASLVTDVSCPTNASAKNRPKPDVGEHASRLIETGRGTYSTSAAPDPADATAPAALRGFGPVAMAAATFCASDIDGLYRQT